MNEFLIIDDFKNPTLTEFLVMNYPKRSKRLSICLPHIHPLSRRRASA
ncbi:MAG: hypothetical protein J6R36_07020 [Bacteroidaceae bacterium]|nr:hypothetical protein [Bacteroidaceae bacterium]